MTPEVRKRLLLEFSAARWVDNTVRELPCEGWFILEVYPTPPPSEKDMVAADLNNSGLIYIASDSGKLYHSDNCVQTNHRLDSHVRRALKSVKNEKFLVAVYTGFLPELKGQPVAIPLEPIISYENYPDHPHINSPMILSNMFFLPETLCYTDNPSGLGFSEYDRFKTAFKEISTWLFRHQVWVASRKFIKPGIWIGPSAESLRADVYPGFLNPTGPCRCGSDNKYIFCHMANDIAPQEEVKSIQEMLTKNILSHVSSWQQRVKIPRDRSLRYLRQNLM